MRAELLELATEAIMVRDLDGAIQFWNTGAETSTAGRAKKPWARNMHTLLQTVFPAPREEIESMLRRAQMLAGQPGRRRRATAPKSSSPAARP